MNILKNEKVSGILYTISIWIWIIAYTVFLQSRSVQIFGDYGTKIYSILRMIALLLLFIQSIVSVSLKKNPKLWICYLAMMSLLALSNYFGGYNHVTSLVLFGFAGLSQKDDKKTVRTFLLCKIVCMIFIVGLALTGAIDNSPIYRDDIPRYMLGYAHPNILAYEISIILVAYYYLNWNRLKKIHYLVPIVASVGIWFLTNSRTGTLMLCFIGCFAFLVHLMKESSVNSSLFVLNIILIAFGVALALFSIHFGVIQNKVVIVLDRLLSGRIRLSKLAFEEFGLSFFGTKSSYVLDIAYVNNLLLNGIVPTLISWLLCVLSICYAWKKKMISMLFVWSFFLLYAFAENITFIPHYNFLLLILFPMLYKWIFLKNTNTAGDK